MVTWFMPILTKQNSKAIDLLTNQASRMTDTRQRLWMHCTWTHAEVITRISLISVNEQQLSFEKGFNHLSNAMISYSIFSNVFNFSEHCHWAPRHRIVLHLLRRPLWKDHERSPQPIKMMINCAKIQCGITFDIISDKQEIKIYNMLFFGIENSSPLSGILEESSKVLNVFNFTSILWETLFSSPWVLVSLCRSFHDFCI